ncbi:MAG TPA: helix-turn-helix domain-containing protein [bacterium]|nr:helix-turn-helix domain-containing protein [bacterium]
MEVMELLTLTAAAKSLGCSIDTLKTLVDQGHVPCIIARPRGDRLFTPEALEVFRRQHRRLPVKPGRRRFAPLNESVIGAR